MTDKKSSVVKIILSLTLVGMVSGSLLVSVYNYAMPKIKTNVRAGTEKAIKNIFPETEEIKNTKEEGVFRAVGENGKFLGYAILAEGNGYQGIIKLIVGVNEDMSEMTGMEVLESQETPGLGAEIAGEAFRKQFEGLSLKHAMEYLKNQKPQEPYQIEAITGATISSRAVVNLLNERLDSVREKLKLKKI